MTPLQKQNRGCEIQRSMSDSGKHPDFSNVFASALRGNPTAFEIFSNWALFHPDLSDALDFLRDNRPDTLAPALGSSPCAI